MKKLFQETIDHLESLRKDSAESVKKAREVYMPDIGATASTSEKPIDPAVFLKALKSCPNGYQPEDLCDHVLTYGNACNEEGRRAAYDNAIGLLEDLQKQVQEHLK